MPLVSKLQNPCLCFSCVSLVDAGQVRLLLVVSYQNIFIYIYIVKARYCCRVARGSAPRGSTAFIRLPVLTSNKRACRSLIRGELLCQDLRSAPRAQGSRCPAIAPKTKNRVFGIWRLAASRPFSSIYPVA